MSGDRHEMVASGDRAWNENAHGATALGRGEGGRDGTSERNGEHGAPSVERWRSSPPCTERERMERWPVG